MNSKAWNAEKIYINEIIRVTYKCNWKCKFCNVLKTNNFWETDVTQKEIIYQILSLVRKYDSWQRKKLILSFSWWEPTLDIKLLSYIKLAKKIWVWIVEVQTNGTRLFKKKSYILDLINAWLDEIFLAQHSWDEQVNKQLWSYYNIDDFVSWTKYILENEINIKISIYLNIVVTKINLFFVHDYITFLLKIWFIKIIPSRDHYNSSFENWYKTHKISFWLVQPNWYAEINKQEVLLKYTYEEITEFDRIIELCKQNNILPDFHFVCPPLCILDYPEYNLEHERLIKLEEHKSIWDVNESNLKSYEFLWKEKRKFNECNNCNNYKYCLGFYKNWIDFVWEKYVIEKINNYLNK